MYSNLEDVVSRLDFTNVELTEEEYKVAELLKQQMIEPKVWEEFCKKSKFELRKALAVVAAIVLTVWTGGAAANAGLP